MTDTRKRKILLLTLVHPDFLPPVYSVAQVLRDEGYPVHILTFDSYVPAHIDLGPGIEIESVGRHHDLSLGKRLAIRGQYKQRAAQLAAENPLAIISFCAFTFLCGLKIRNKIPLIYHALEVADFIMSLFLKSPLSHFNNLRAIKKLNEASLVVTPSVQRSAWLAGRAHIESMPVTVLNTAYLKDKDGDSYGQYKQIIPATFLDKKVILYTGAVNTHLCTMELVQAFDLVNDQNSALIITGIKDNGYCAGIKQFVSQSRAAERIQLFPYLARTEMLALQANAAIGVCLAREYNDNLESKMMAPNKVGEYLARGLYLLGIKNEYLLPFKMKGIASLAETVSPAEIAVAIKDALAAVDNGNYKTAISNFVADYFCMQQQMKPVTAYLKGLGQ